MDVLCKFSKEERQSLERIAGIVFNGGRIPEKFKKEAEGWLYAISRFLTAVNRENGSLSLDPFRDYPNKTYLVYEALQGSFTAMIKKKTEAAVKKKGR